MSLPREALLESKRPCSVKFSHVECPIVEVLFGPLQCEAESPTVPGSAQTPHGKTLASFCFDKVDLRPA